MQNNTDPSISQPTVGKVLLDSRGFYTKNYWYWICIAALFGFSVLFNALFVAALTFLNRKLSNFSFVSCSENQISSLTNTWYGKSISAIGDSKATIIEENGDKKNKKPASGQETEGFMSLPCYPLFMCLSFYLFNKQLIYFATRIGG